MNSSFVDWFIRLDGKDQEAIELNLDAPDLYLARIARDCRCDGHPVVLPHPVFVNKISRGNRLYRGVTHLDFAKRFRRGDYWAGKGLKGNGTYTYRCESDNEARKKAMAYAVGEFGAELGVVMAMSLSSQAVLYPYSEVQKRLGADRRHLQAHFQSLCAMADPSEQDGLKNRFRGASAVYSDTGRYMASSGIDAYIEQLPTGRYGTLYHVVIVNRSIVIVSEKDF